MRLLTWLDNSITPPPVKVAALALMMMSVTFPTDCILNVPALLIVLAREPLLALGTRNSVPEERVSPSSVDAVRLSKNPVPVEVRVPPMIFATLSNSISLPVAAEMVPPVLVKVPLPS